MALHEPGIITIPVSAAETSPAAWVPPATVLPILERIERLPEGSSGALLVGHPGNEIGTVLVDRGKICWAASGGMVSRLTTLLCHQADPPITPAQLDALYRDCRRSGAPLLSSLVARGVVRPEILQRILRQHSAEAIVVMSTVQGPSPPLRWQVRESAPFDSKHAFTPTQILSTIGAFENPIQAQQARGWLRTTIAEGDCGFIFRRAQGTLFPVGQQGGEHLLMGEVLEVGTWARNTLDVATALSGQVPLVSGSSPAGGSVVAWKKHGVIFLVFSAGGSKYARLVSRLCRELSAE